MKKARKASYQILVLLLVLFLTAYGHPQLVTAGTDNQEKYNPLFVNVLPEDFRKILCPGDRAVLKYIVYYYVDYSKAPPLIPRGGIPAKVTLSTTSGTVRPSERTHNVRIGKTFTGDFSYTAGTETGSATITITASMAGYETPFPLTFEIKPCEASLQFSQQMTYSYGMVSIITTYSGSGSLKVDKDGRVSGSGSQSIWSDIPPYSEDGGSCTHSPPWEGSSGITFSGQIDDNGDSQVNMNLEAVSVNTTTLTCTGEDSSGSMVFPGYTYEACQVLLDDINFEAGTRDVQFDCPGEEPYTVPITLIPRSEK